MRKPNNYLIIYDETINECKAFSMQDKRAIIRFILNTTYMEHNLKITSTLINFDSNNSVTKM